MDVKAYLISQGTDDATATEIAANPKYAAIYEKAAAEAENGKTALLKAQEVEKSLKTWNETQVVPYVQKADATVAAERAKNAAMTAHMKSLKDAGYDIPDAYLGDSTSGGGNNNVTPPPAAVAGKDYDDLIQKGQLAQMELIDLANEAFDLTGKRIRVNDEYKQFANEARPGENLRSYVTRKYDLDSIRTKRTQEADQKRLDDYAATKVAAEKAEWAKSHGSNGETRLPESSRFAKIAEERAAGGAENGKLWQTKAGREQATQQRLEKYNGRVN